MELTILATDVIYLEYDEEKWQLFVDFLIPEIEMDGLIEKPTEHGEPIEIKSKIIIDEIILPGTFFTNNNCYVETTMSEEISNQLSLSTRVLLGCLDNQRYLLRGFMLLNDGKVKRPIFIVLWKHIEIAVYTFEPVDFNFTGLN